MQAHISRLLHAYPSKDYRSLQNAALHIYPSAPLVFFAKDTDKRVFSFFLPFACPHRRIRLQTSWWQILPERMPVLYIFYLPHGNMSSGYIHTPCHCFLVCQISPQDIRMCLRNRIRDLRLLRRSPVQTKADRVRLPLPLHLYLTQAPGPYLLLLFLQLCRKERIGAAYPFGFLPLLRYRPTSCVYLYQKPWSCPLKNNQSAGQHQACQVCNLPGLKTSLLLQKYQAYYFLTT